MFDITTHHDPEEFIRESLLSEAESQIKELLVNLKKARTLKGFFAKKVASGKRRYKVVLVSMWTDHGELDVMVIQVGTLLDVMTFAAAEFKRKNNRSDIQAHWHVYAVVRDRSGLSISAPVQSWHWQKHMEKLKDS
jgi:hypothetical protein